MSIALVFSREEKGKYEEDEPQGNQESHEHIKRDMNKSCQEEIKGAG